MSEYGVDLAEWYAAGRWVALLDFIDMLPSACRLNEAISNDPAQAKLIAAAPKPSDPWSPRVSEFDLNAMLQQQILHAILALKQTTIALKGQHPGEVTPFPSPRTAIDKALENMERAAAVQLVEMFGFSASDI